MASGARDRKTIMYWGGGADSDVGESREVLIEAVRRAGTPVFVCSQKALVEQYKNLERSLEWAWPKSVIGYSFKANYEIARHGVFRDLGAWAEVVSGYEYRLAKCAGYDAGNIIFNGPYKTDAELQAAMEDGALLIVNDPSELDRLIRLVGGTKKRVDMGLRIRASSKKLGSSRFGFSLESHEAARAVRIIGEIDELGLVALHTHLHGDTDDEGLYRCAANRLGEFAAKHIRQDQEPLKFLDLGGGFPSRIPKPYSRDSWAPKNIHVYVNAITDALSSFYPEDADKPTLILEPGGFLVNEPVVLVTRVIHVDRQPDRRIVNCNGSITMVPLTHYRPQVIGAYSTQFARRKEAEAFTMIYGASCRENDILFEGNVPDVEVGDYLIHFSVGAYNANLSPEFIFERPAMEFV